MNRLERLLNLVAALLDADRPLTRAEIHERVPGYGEGESARRAFERDKDALRAMGIPLVMEPLRGTRDQGEGYRIPPEQYELPDPGLAPDELAALHLAASTVRLGAAGGPGEAGMALWKLGGAVGGGGQAPLADLPGGEHLPVLFGAVSERRTVRFAYRGQERRVDPYRLSFANGHWYLIGHDHRRDEERSFRLDRMESAPVAGQAAGIERRGPARGPAPAPWRMGDEEEVEAVLLVDAEQAPWAVAKLGEGAMRERRPDGSAVVTLSVTNRDAFRTFALGFLHHAEVLGPPELRQDMVDWLQGVGVRAGQAAAT